MQRDLGGSNLATAAGLGAILLWSWTFALARSVTEQVGPLTAGAAAYLLGGTLFLLLRRIAKPSARAVRPSSKYLAGCGFLFVLYTACIYLAVGRSEGRAQVLEIALVNYLWPTATILLSLPLLKQRASGWLIPGTLMALVGIFLVLTQSAEITWSAFQNHVRKNPVPYLLALVAAVSWGLYSNCTRLWSTPETRGAVDWFVAATGIVLLGLRLMTPEPQAWSWKVVAEISALGAVTACSYQLWDFALRRGRLLMVFTASYFTPLLSTLVSSLYLQVAPSPKLWIGGALLVSGSLVSWASTREPPRKIDAL